MFNDERLVRKRITKELSSRIKNKKCLYPSCNETAIASHSISKRALKTIAEDGHVIARCFDRQAIGRTVEDFLNHKDINLKFEKIGTGQASTFAGFCSNHDNCVFRNVDDHETITQEEVLLRLYRVISRYLLHDSIITKSEYAITRNYYHCNPSFESKIPLNLERIHSLIQDLVVGPPDELKNPINISADQFLTIKPFSDVTSIRPVILFKKIRISYPLAMQNDLTIKNGNTYSHCLFYLEPFSNGSDLIILCSPDILPFFGNYLTTEIGILNCIESVLMSDSDFYIKPSIYQSWSSQKKKQIEEDYYFFHERSFLEEYDISLFDDIRRDICNNLEDEKKEHELKKINSLPLRQSFEYRNVGMINKTIAVRHSKIAYVLSQKSSDS